MRKSKAHHNVLVFFDNFTCVFQVPPTTHTGTTTVLVVVAMNPIHHHHHYQCGRVLCTCIDESK